ncbi:MAG TPA: cysteine hydrolase [Candidatus Blautia ornithocaccae]|nr:cysteine hydrolase [Candidatus Blautia ornithocaccae]
MKKLLVVVDMQKDFIDGALGTGEAVKILEPVKEKIRKAKAQGTDIVFTKDTHYKDYLMTQEGRKLPVPHCVKGTEGWELDRGLLELAQKAGYEEIELIGLCTDICVISNAMILKAALPEAVVRVDPSCCAGVTPESHRNALEAMKVCQIEVV